MPIFRGVGPSQARLGKKGGILSQDTQRKDTKVWYEGSPPPPHMEEEGGDGGRSAGAGGQGRQQGRAGSQSRNWGAGEGVGQKVGRAGQGPAADTAPTPLLHRYQGHAAQLSRHPDPHPRQKGPVLWLSQAEMFLVLQQGLDPCPVPPSRQLATHSYAGSCPSQLFFGVCLAPLPWETVRRPLAARH